MKINTDNLRIQLQHGLTIELSDAKNMWLNCLEGVLWITQHHDGRDYLLHAGQSMKIINNGIVIVHSGRNACFVALSGVQTTKFTWLKRLSDIGLLLWLKFTRRLQA